MLDTVIVGVGRRFVIEATSVIEVDVVVVSASAGTDSHRAAASAVIGKINRRHQVDVVVVLLVRACVTAD